WLDRAFLRTRSALRQLKGDVAKLRARLDKRSDEWDWPRFHREVRGEGRRLLCRLDRFPDAVLISGCQRSGTTMLSRIIRESAGMANYRRRDDDELDAALILAGVESPSERSEQHTSELQSRENLVCRLLLETNERRA